MRDKKIILLLFIFVVLMSGCKKKEEPFMWTPPPAATEVILADDNAYSLIEEITINKVDTVQIRVYNSSLEADFIPVSFTEHGLLNGRHHLLVPLTEQSGSIFNMLGMIVSIDISGQKARLTRGQTYLDFTEGLISMFINDEDVRYLTDMPLYYRGTLFIPFEPILDEFEIPWEIEENILTIGG
jgi:hypothetical protein